MKKTKALNLIIAIILFLANDLKAQIGYYDAPYTRYEADLGTLTNGAVATSKSYDQSTIQSEASDQICVNLSAASATVRWTVSAVGDGLVIRYCVPIPGTNVDVNVNGTIDVYANGVNVGSLTLTTYYSWEDLKNNGNPNNSGVVNANYKMRFDEVRMKLPSKILVGQNLKLVRTSGNIYIDFAELESIPAAVTASGSDIIYDGSTSLQSFITTNGGATIYLPAGTYNVNNTLVFSNANTTLKGAGIWYTEIHFTNGTSNNGGLWGQASNISYSGLFLTTDRNSRSSSYKAINGVYTATSTITNVWAEHFECGAWIAQFGAGPAIANGFTMSYCRFRNNYADGTNLSKGTSNAIVEHCSYRNNGDDDMAIWPANNQSCDNNTFRYNTAENSWRASGCAIYGGLSNQAHHLLIKDNLEAGLRAGNNFDGSPFSTSGMHVFSNIRIISGGTFQDLFNKPVGAIDLLVTTTPGTGSRVTNVKFSCIEIINSKNDAIDANRISTGDGFYNLVFENITIDGTGKEYPNNGGAVAGRGYDVLFSGSPGGTGTYCGMSYANRGGSATVNTSGSYSWSLAGSCPTGCLPMPVELLTFTGKKINQTIVLDWTTTLEKNNQKFIIERSADGADWQALGEVAGRGNTTTVMDYSFTDYTFFEGIVYYRLKQIDIDNAFAYSNTVGIQTAEEHYTSISPNPFEDAFTIKTNIKENIDISVSDVLGRQLYHINKESDNGALVIQPDLMSGAYVVTMQSGSFIEHKKIIKK